MVNFQLHWSMFLIVCPLCFLAGFVDSVAGGGGLISLPAYYLAGLPPYLAAGTNKLSACLGTLTATGRFLRGGKVAIKQALLAAIGSLIGSAIGTNVMLHIPQQTVRIMMIIAIPIVACVVLRRGGKLEGTCRVKEKHVPLVSFLIGLSIGFYDGIVGPGTGTFLILLFTMVLGMEAVTASGSAKVVNLASNMASLVTMLISGKVVILLGLPAALFGIAGNYLGSGMTMKRGTGFIRVMLLIVLALLLAKMVVDVV